MLDGIMAFGHEGTIISSISLLLYLCFVSSHNIPNSVNNSLILLL